jgi:flagellar biosynthesis component FlhA
MCDFDTVVADGAALIVFDDRLAVRTRPDPAWLADPRTLTAFVRTALKRQITQATLGGKSRLEVWLVDSDIERALVATARPDARQPGNGRLSETRERALLRGMHADLGWSVEKRAPVFLTTAEARAPLRALLADQWPAATVVAYQELRADSTIHQLGRISFDD